jgi:hypothetical protein
VCPGGSTQQQPERRADMLETWTKRRGVLTFQST